MSCNSYGDPKTLHVISVISNPVQFSTRYELYRKFEREMKQAGVNLITVEMAFGHRPHCVTEAGNPSHVQLRSFDEIWHKENMINLGVERLPTDWEYVAWIDSDVSFIDPNWVKNTIDSLQHYHVVQLFQHAIDLGPKNENVQNHNGFVSQYLSGAPRGPGYTFWHPGYAWAMRREAFDAVGGLIDIAILGAGDHHMALGFIHQARQSIPGDMSLPYLQELLRWEDRCRKYIKKDIGFLPGTLLHGWHGKKKNRKYVERWGILRDFKYNPITDLKEDWQGLWQLVVEDDRQIGLRDGIRAYFRQRSEDSTDLD
jgi:hypothetical protein